MALNTRRGWVRGKHSPIKYANHYTMNRYGKILNQLLILLHFEDIARGQGIQHGEGKNNGQGNLPKCLIYTSPTKDRPWTSIKLLVPY